MKSPNLLGVVFVFGLIHGFGLSTRLQQLPLGEDAMGMLLRIISFNVGVELGQIAALVVMVGILTAWRRSTEHHFRRFSIISNNALIFAGFYLFYYQTHGFLHDIQADDLRFSSTEHKHAHEDLDIEQESKETSHDSL
jgi:ABC-type nickel/cobalt efflux system permease component RcnA